MLIKILYVPTAINGRQGQWFSNTDIHFFGRVYMLRVCVFVVNEYPLAIRDKRDKHTNQIKTENAAGSTVNG